VTDTLFHLRGELSRGLATGNADARLHAPDISATWADLATRRILPRPLAALEGCSALLLTTRQSSAAAALLALDGVARRIVLCPPDFDLRQLPLVASMAEIDLLVTDSDIQAPGGFDVQQISLNRPGAPVVAPPARAEPTEWVMFTSGTTGTPKLVVHTLAGLTGAIRAAQPPPPPVVWGTFYDIRRYGGLQILLRALLGGASLAVTDSEESVGAFLTRLGKVGVTHLTGTPSHWRRALMSPQVSEISPAYVRLSGEIADQAVLDRLAGAFPDAKIGHAFASTEAGVGFEVTDGLEGFPKAFLDRTGGPVDLRLVDGVLQIRSDRTAKRYLGETPEPLVNAEGFVDTDDQVDVRGDRCFFTGRRNGLINIGGLKIHPEEVEAVINRHPDVDISRVFARKSPITGALVAAEVVLISTFKPQSPSRLQEIRIEILSLCRAALGPAGTPATVNIIDALPLTAGGKLERRRA